MKEGDELRIPDSIEVKETENEKISDSFLSDLENRVIF